MLLKALKSNKGNPRKISEAQVLKLQNSISEFEQMMELRPIIIDETNTILGGNMRFLALKKLGYEEIPDAWVKVAAGLTDAQKKEFIIKDNVSFGEWDWDVLKSEWSDEPLADWGLEMPEFEDDDNNTNNEVHSKLKDTFIVPPFSILDARQNSWIERKQNWKNIILDKGESRENKLSGSKLMSEINNGVSILDPVLAEIIILWFGLPNCNIFDCFAGDTVFGYVSGFLKNNFIGIELRKEQADFNNERTKLFNVKYICDDGRNVLNYIEKNSQDLLFSCPPYFDLEVYSSLKNDASNQESYEDFLKILDEAFTNSIQCLKENRFAAITIGDIRDKDGYYYGFIEDIKSIFKKNKMYLYNEIILIEPLGTLPQRVGRYMNNRKVGKCHQNVLIFFKGNCKEIKNIYPNLKDYESTDF